MKTRQRSESGQALILLTLAIVALLGFTALAVDGSMVYSDRRFAQTAADASALAGASAAAQVIANQAVTSASWNCASSALQSAINAARLAAIQRGGANNVVLDDDISDDHGVSVVCNSSGSDKYLDVIVRVTQQTETAFAQVITSQPVRNQVIAVARVRPKKTLAFGYTIVALNPAGCNGQSNGATFYGNPDVNVCGGGIFSNGCLRGNGNIDVYVKDLGCTSIAPSGLFYAREVIGSSKFHPAPQSASAIPTDAYTLDFTPEQLCARPGAHHVTIENIPEVLTPGLWCITGDISIHGADLQNHSKVAAPPESGDESGLECHINKLYGEGVTLVFLNGGMTCNGNCDFRISAPAASPDPYPAVPGLLIYSTAKKNWKLNGNSVSYFRGTILLPKADVTMNGTGNETAYYTQVITWNFHGGGTNDSIFRWDDQWMFSEPVTVELNK